MVGAKSFLLLDGFFGYNQIFVREEDIFKMAFITKWGTMAYVKMPFGLSNASIIFQRAMDFAFKVFINKFILIYLDDIRVFSKRGENHMEHLE